MISGRFLYLSYFLPPLGKAESRHNVAWLRELVEQGFSAEVMMAAETENYPEDSSLLTYMPSRRTRIHRVMKRSEGGKLVRYLRYKAGLIDLVSYSGWEVYLEYALRLHEEHPFDFIYSVYGLPLSHKIALEMKKQTGLPWIAEFRDPMVHNFILGKLLDARCLPFWQKRQREKMYQFEGDIVRDSDLVIVESPHHDKQLIEEFKLPPSKVLPLGIGFDSSQFPGITAKDRSSRPLKIGYIGSLYEGYGPMVDMLMEGFSAIQKQGMEFELIVVGDDRRIFEDMAAKHGFVNLVHKGRVSQEEALEEMCALDVGIIMIDQGYPLINSKFWEYLYARLSILTLAPENGAMARWVKENEAGYVLPYLPGGITEVLKCVFNDVNRGKLKVVDTETVQSYDATNIVSQIVDRIRPLLKGGIEPE